MDKSPEAFRTISEVAIDLEIPKHVLRFWEGKFSQLRPLKRGGGRRYYRPEDIDLLRGIRQLLYGEGYTIKGVQRILREQGVRSVIERSAETAGGSTQAAVTEIPDVAADAARSASEQSGEGSPGKGLNKGQTKQLHEMLAELENCKQLLVVSKD